MIRSLPVIRTSVNPLLKTLALLSLTVLLPQLPTTVNAAEPPAGYYSVSTLKLAYLSGSLELVDKDLPLSDAVELTEGIKYGKAGGTDLKLDLYRPKKQKENAPCLIFVHGGGWKKGHRKDYRYYGIKMAEKGYVVASISYRFSQKAKFPAAVHDCKCAVRFTRSQAKKWNIDPDRIAMIGGSAGGHLSMMVGYTAGNKELEGKGGHAEYDSSVKMIVNLYGPCDVTTEEARTNSLVTGFIGKPYTSAKKQYELASPLFQIDKGDTPTLIFHGTLDDIVNVSQADTLAKKLKETGVPMKFNRLTGWPHTMDAAKPVNEYCMKEMLAFFDEHLN